MGGTLLQPLLQKEHCVTLIHWCCWVPADNERTRHRANFEEAQQGHRQLGLWQGPWQRQDPPRPNQALQVALLQSLHVVVCHHQQEWAVPYDMRDAKIINLGLVHDREMRQASDVAAFSILLLISVSKERLSVMVEPRYVNCSMTSRSYSPMVMAGSSIVSRPRMLWVVGLLVVFSLHLICFSLCSFMWTKFDGISVQCNDRGILWPFIYKLWLVFHKMQRFL